MQSAQEQLEIYSAYFKGKNAPLGEKNPYTSIVELAAAWEDGYEEARMLELVGHCKTMLTAMNTLFGGFSGGNNH